MKKTIIILVIIIAAVAGASYLRKDVAPGGTPTNSAEGAPEGSLHNLPVPTAVAEAKEQLALRLSIPKTTIVVMSAFEKEWTDGCLGLGGPAESCLMSITPGYEVTMEAEGKTYVYRTDESGLQVRAAN